MAQVHKEYQGRLDGSSAIVVADENGSFIADFGTEDDWEAEEYANQFITAYNAHEDLIAALESTQILLEDISHNTKRLPECQQYIKNNSTVLKKSKGTLNND